MEMMSSSKAALNRWWVGKCFILNNQVAVGWPLSGGTLFPPLGGEVNGWRGGIVLCSSFSIRCWNCNHAILNDTFARFSHQSIPCPKLVRGCKFTDCVDKKQVLTHFFCDDLPSGIIGAFSGGLTWQKAASHAGVSNNGLPRMGCCVAVSVPWRLTEQDVDECCHVGDGH